MNIIKVQNFEKYIREFFPLDKHLMDYYHIEAGKGVELCVNRTVKDLKDCKDGLNFFLVTLDNKEIGFFGTEKLDNLNILTTIFIKPEYRKKEFVSEFWNKINQYFEYKSFLVGVYDHNTPAILFYRKNNGKLKSYKNNVLIFEFKEDIVCQ